MYFYFKNLNIDNIMAYSLYLIVVIGYLVVVFFILNKNSVLISWLNNFYLY